MMLGDVGDVLLATPALQQLRSAYPRARVTTLTKPTTVAVLTHSGLADHCLTVDKHLFDRPASLFNPLAALRLLRLVAVLRQGRFDTVVILHHLTTLWGTVKFALLSLVTGAPRRAGLDNGRGPFLTHVAPDQGFDAAHEAQYWQRVVTALAGTTRTAAWRASSRLWRERRQGRGAPVAAERIVAPGISAPADDLPAPAFVVPGNAQASADAILREAGIFSGVRVLALHPGSGAYSVARRWYPERFAAVADILAQRHGLQVVLLGGADERALTEQVIAHMRTPAVSIAGRTDLAELGGVLRRCALMIGNDAGVAHLASAVGTPVVAVFGPFNHHTWRPLGRSLVVRAAPALPCMPCVNRGFARGYPEGCAPRYCLREVTPTMVVAAAEHLLRAAAL